MLPIHSALRILKTERLGSSRPVLVETERGLYFTKLRGAAQGLAALVAEIIVAEIAERLDLKVPQRVLIDLRAETISEDKDAELADLLRASYGLNLGFEYMPRAANFRVEQIARISPDLASQILWLDALVMNPDRTPRNPNLMLRNDELWLIDHGACLGFHYRWRAVKEDSPRRSFALEPHLLHQRATRLAHWDERLSARLSRNVLRDALALVPDDFLQPLLSHAEASHLQRRREAYIAFLWKRLKPPRPFLPEKFSPKEV